MEWQPNSYSFALLVAALIALSVAIAAWQRRPKAGATPLAVLMLGLVWWAVFESLCIGSADIPSKLLWSKFEYLGIVIVPPATLLLVLEHTGLDALWMTRRRKLRLAIEPIVILILVWTNDIHQWIWVSTTIKEVNQLKLWDISHGWGFWAHTVYSYILLVLSFLLLLRAVIKSARPYRQQTLILLIAELMPALGNAISIFDIINLPVDITPYAFTLTGIITFWGLFRHKLLELAPVARSTLVDSMGDAMIVVDLEGRIVDINTAALKLIEHPVPDILGTPLADLLPQYTQLFELYASQLEVQTEIKSNTREKTWYDLRVSPLYDHRKNLQGRIIVLRDISERKKLESSLELQIQQVKKLLEVARITAKTPTLEDTMNSALEIAQSITRANAGSLLLINENHTITHSILTRDAVTPNLKKEIIARVISEGLIGYVLKQQETILINETSTDPRWLTLPNQPYEVGSALCVPILYGEKLIGGITVLHRRPHHFTEEDAKILEAAGRQMALSIANALVYEEQRTVAEQQTTLFETLRALQHPMSLQEAMTEAVTIIAELTSWPLVAVLCPEDAGKPGKARKFQIGVASGRMAAYAHTLTYSKCPACDPALTNQEDQDFNCFTKILPDRLFPSKYASLLQCEPQRILLVASDTTQAFEGDGELLASSISNVVTLVLRNAQLYESVDTERQRLAALIESIHDGILLISIDNQILVISQSAIDYLNLTGTPQDWRNRPITDALQQLRRYAPDVVRTTLSEVHRLRQGDETAATGEYQVAGKTLQWMNLPVQESQRTLGRLLIIHDVTAEHQLAQVREDLTHTMVHDMRNPLTSIYGALRLLEKQLKPTLTLSQQELFNISRSSTDRLLKLINAILEINRLESERMPLNITEFPICNLAKEVLQFQLPLTQHKTIQLINELDTNCPLVLADHDMITRVLQNLVDNALKFTPAGGTVWLSYKLPDNKAGKLYVSVRDTGPGIPPEIAPKLFQKFVTGQQAESGSGLGLAFCKMVLEAHNEHIWVDSQPGQGTTFTFTLPVA